MKKKCPVICSYALFIEREARLNGETLFEQELKKARGKDLDTGSIVSTQI